MAKAQIAFLLGQLETSENKYNLHKMQSSIIYRLLMPCFVGFNLTTLTTPIKQECIEIQLKCEMIDEVHGGISKQKNIFLCFNY